VVLAATAPSATSAQVQSQAQSPGPAAAARPGGATDARLDDYEARLRTLRIASRNRSADDQALRAQQAAIAPIQAELDDLLSKLTPRLADARERLAELGPAPAAGQAPEAPDVADARARLLKQQKRLDDNSKRARLLSVEASQLSESLARRLRGNFSARLWAHDRSAFDVALWGDFAASLPQDLQRARDAVSVEARPPAAASRGAAEVQSAILAILGLMLLVPARIILGRLGRRWSVAYLPDSALRKSAPALWLTLVGGVTPPLAALLLLSALSGIVQLTPAAHDLARAFIGALFYAAIIDALGRSLLAPGRPSWRLAPVSDVLVDRLAVFPAVIGAAAGLASFLSQANVMLGASQPATEASRCAGVVMQILAVGGALVWARSAPASEEETGAAGSTLPWVLAAVAAWLSLGAALAAVATGYVAFASFVMRELIWIATVLASLFLLMRFVDDLCDALLGPRRRLSRLIGVATGLSGQALEQIGVLLSGVLRLGLMVFGWMAIVAPFGGSAQEMLARATSTEMVFKLGQISISPGLIFGGLAVFTAGLVITRVVRGWVETTYLPRTHIDVGVRTSITAGLTYLGALIALLTACAYLGLSLSNIALVASALSVGIGFGLQAVIGNFVSGLILLAERPVKVGDRIAIGDQEGDVRRINIRSTEIEMGDRSKLIVPNSELVTKMVRNVTPGGALGQVKIVLRVANDADAAQVGSLLLEQLTRHPSVQPEPRPSVYLTNVANGGLEFTALAAVASPRQTFGIKSDLLFAMVAELKARGVNLATT